MVEFRLDRRSIISRKPSVRVTPKGDQWQVKTDGAQKAAKVTDTQKQAIDVGKQIAKNKGTELIIQGKGGKIRSKDSYGQDPNPPKDKEH